MKIGAITFGPSVRGRFVLTGIIAAALFCAANGKTRWSSIYLVPDADMLDGGQFLVGFNGFVSKDTTEKSSIGQTYLLRLGIIEWVNIHLGYAGGPTVGFKARILGETRPLIPSLSIGAHNVFTHKEAHYYRYESESDPETELFIALGKSFETVKARFHAGVQTVPRSESEAFNPYFALEKYFGLGIYSSFILHRRDRAFRGSAFLNWRLFKNHVELCAGAVDLQDLFIDHEDGISPSLVPDQPAGFSRPGIWIGIRFQHAIGLGRAGGFASVEDRLARQDDRIGSLESELDSIRLLLDRTHQSISAVEKSVHGLADSIGGHSGKLKAIMLDKIVRLKSLYEVDRFEPEKVRRVAAEIVGFGDRAVPALKEILLDRKVDRRLRMHAASMLGEIGNKTASDALLDLLTQTGDTEIKVELLIALGKMNETRAMYLMEQLANDPDDAVALAAQEVLRRMAERTGARITPGTSMREIDRGAAAKPKGANLDTTTESGSQVPPVAGPSSPAGTEISPDAPVDTLPRTPAPRANPRPSTNRFGGTSPRRPSSPRAPTPPAAPTAPPRQESENSPVP
ncbi:MAG: hypothetical protein GF344_05415, partial [Chitinivibrionales bacterium]|nr:hypothetical protein [Chitinivibrionales bacterium]MBD3356415.1 hypothetical protein [Chitinivibrionales bacterium]